MTTLSLLWLLFVPFQGDAEADQIFPLRGDYGASHILISYKGADRAKAHVTRNKKEAKALAEELAGKLANDPDAFESMAREYSDGPSAMVGGFLKPFKKGDMAPPFEKALRKIEPGQIVAGPVKTQFGYHLIRRNPLSGKYYSARAILITHKDAARVRGVPSDSPAWQRESTKAKTNLDALAGKVTNDNFEAMMKEHSDLTGTGYMGTFKQGDGPVTDRMIDTLKTLPYDGLSDVVELQVGWAILQRQKVEKLAASRIWIRYKGAKNAPASVTRTKDEAKSMAEGLFQQVKSNPGSFESIAKEHSDGPFAVRGGSMASWFKGSMEPEFEAEMSQLKPGDISSKVVETESGFYIIRRNELKK